MASDYPIAMSDELPGCPTYRGLNGLHEYLGAFRLDYQDGTRDACRVLLVGEDNPQSTEPRHALFPHPPGCAGWNLARLTGDSRRHLATWRTNLCMPTWSAAAARSRAHDLLFYAGRPWRTLVLLGRKVAGAFERALRPSTPGLKLDSMSATVFDECGRIIGAAGGRSLFSTDITLISLPHPSGRCRVWNDPEQVRFARALLALAAPEWYGACST